MNLVRTVFHHTDFFRQDQVASPANRNSKVEESQHLRPKVLDEEIADNCWCNGRVAGFTDPDTRPECKEPTESLKGRLN